MNAIASEGQIYVCGACGRRSKDKYGDQAIDYAWDASCMLNSVLCKENSLEFDDNKRVIKADSVEES